MSTTGSWTSGKGDRDENFPVASWLVSARHRPAILAFYRFARAADDAADHGTLSTAEKLHLLDELEATLAGDAAAADALPLASVLRERDLTPRHARDLVSAFRRDVTTPRTATWAELMDYCALSAMPVGRFVLDVHGEARSTWAASDPLCAALQVINHLQDCGKDFAAINRVYLPTDLIGRYGADVADLARDRATPALRSVIADLAGRTQDLLLTSAPLASGVADWRLSMEIAAIQNLAERLAGKLTTADRLRDPVRVGTGAKLSVLMAALLVGVRRVVRPGARPAIEGGTQR